MQKHNRVYTKITILSYYNVSAMLPFGESMREALLSALSDLSYDVQHIYIRNVKENINLNDSIIIFLMSPEAYLMNKDLVIKNNNKFVLWNLEPFYIDQDGPIKKFIKRRENINKIINEKDIDCIWFYNKKQFNYFNSGLYLPIGFSTSFGIFKLYCDNKDMIFVGHVSKKRKKMLDDTKKYGMNCNIIDYKSFTNTQDFKYRIHKFSIGVDIDAHNLKDNVRWHRIMLFAANGIAIASTSDLSEYGFKDGVHYIYFENIENLYNKIKKIDNQQIHKIAKNMYDKVISEYSMKKLLKLALEEI